MNLYSTVKCLIFADLLDQIYILPCPSATQITFIVVYISYGIVGASLSEPHSNVENVRWSMREEPRRKTGLQHTTVVWYGGLCTNKHDKLTDTSIQVLWHCKNIRLHVLTFHIRLVRSTMHEQ